MRARNPDLKTIRFKTSCGLTMSFGLYRADSGKFRLRSAGKASGRNGPVPIDFVPFEITNAVINGADYDSMDALEVAVRQL